MAFHVGRAEPLRPDGERRVIEDPSRGAVLQFVGGRGPLPGGRSFIFTVGDHKIPFDTVTDPVADERGTHWLTQFDSFGASFTVARLVEIPEPKFASQSERDEAQSLAAEALLVFGQSYDGLDLPDGEVRVLWHEREWVLSDFGYLTSGDIDGASHA